MSKHVAGKRESDGHMVEWDKPKWTTSAIIINQKAKVKEKERKDSHNPNIYKKPIFIFFFLLCSYANHDLTYYFNLYHCIA